MSFKRSKVVSVCDVKDAVLGTNTERGIRRLCFKTAGFERTVGKYKTVAAEVAVIRKLALKITAVALRF